MLAGNSPALYHLLLVPVAIIFADAFIDREPLYDGEKGRFNATWIAVFAAAGIVLVFLLWKFRSDMGFLALFTVPAIMLLAYLLYFTDILHGGADAKALMAIGMLVPLYPELGSFPVWSMRGLGGITTVIFPFALTMLMNAAILAVFLPLGLAVYNISKRSVRFPAMLLGYRVPVGEVNRERMWLMEKVRDGKLVMKYMPERNRPDTYDEDRDKNKDDGPDDRSDGDEGTGDDAAIGKDAGKCDAEKGDDEEGDGNDDNDKEPTEEIDDDRLDEEQFKKDIDALRNYGLDRVWVSPKLPFIVFMAAGLVISFIIGNLLFGLVSGIAGIGR
jgi:hypothetical protein